MKARDVEANRLWKPTEIADWFDGYIGEQVVEPPGLPRAAVALILKDGPSGSEFVAIHRAHREGDPWSGHVALPGGRQQAGDATLIETAMRETLEEIGIDLGRWGRPIAELDELRAVGRGRLLDLVIRPILFLLLQPVELRPNPAEVQKALWIPLGALHIHPHEQETHDTAPSFEYSGYTIWGLTHRILSRFIELADRLHRSRLTQRPDAR